jgi:predicted MFS family arabinose efflux permease
MTCPALGFPLNYAALFAAGGILLLFSLAAFAFVDEPPWAPPPRPRESLSEYIRSVPGLLRRKPAAGRLTLVRVLVTGVNVAVPFLAVYGREELGLAPGSEGVFVSAQMAGLVIGGLVWARVADFRGNRLLIRLAAAVSGLASAMPLLFSLLPAGRLARLVYPLVFVAAGGAFSSTWMAFTNYLLELTDQAERPYYLGAVNTILAPFGFFGALGGIVVALAGYRACFVLAGALTWLGFALSASLPEPRLSAGEG